MESTGLENYGPILLSESTRLESCLNTLQGVYWTVELWPQTHQGVYRTGELWPPTLHRVYGTGVLWPNIPQRVYETGEQWRPYFSWIPRDWREVLPYLSWSPRDWRAVAQYSANLRDLRAVAPYLSGSLWDLSAVLSMNVLEFHHLFCYCSFFNYARCFLVFIHIFLLSERMWWVEVHRVQCLPEGTFSSLYLSVMWHDNSMDAFDFYQLRCSPFAWNFETCFPQYSGNYFRCHCSTNILNINILIVFLWVFQISACWLTRVGLLLGSEMSCY